jgi:acyl carrier protein
MNNINDRYARLSPDQKALVGLRLQKLAPPGARRPAGGKRLVAYVVFDGAQRTSELRQHLKERLPEHMIPSAFVTLEQLPLSPNGKVDRKALPAPEGGRPELDQAFVAPRSSVEETLAAIWAEVLRLERIGVNDNFFDLGGHSLLATRVMSRVHSAFGVNVPLRDFFENPTVAGLGLTVVRHQTSQAESGDLEAMLAALEDLGDDEDLPAEG